MKDVLEAMAKLLYIMNDSYPTGDNSIAHRDVIMRRLEIAVQNAASPRVNNFAKVLELLATSADPN